MLNQEKRKITFFKRHRTGAAAQIIRIIRHNTGIAARIIRYNTGIVVRIIYRQNAGACREGIIYMRNASACCGSIIDRRNACACGENFSGAALVKQPGKRQIKIISIKIASRCPGRNCRFINYNIIKCKCICCRFANYNIIRCKRIRCRFANYNIIKCKSIYCRRFRLTVVIYIVI